MDSCHHLPPEPGIPLRHAVSLPSADRIHGVANSIKLLLTTTVMSALLTAAALVYIVLAWKDRYWGIAFRVYYTNSIIECHRPRLCLVPQPMEPVRVACSFSPPMFPGWRAY